MTELNCRLATEADLAALCQFYQDICAHQKDDQFGADWHWGIYPSEKDIASAGILTVGNDPLYSKFTWPTPAEDNEIAVLHLYGVHPSFRRQGLSSVLLTFIKDQTKKLGCKSIRLDSMDGNVPARRLYEKNGWRFVSQETVYYDDIGDCKVDLLELAL
ncbi:GNAT family N-acetyltransferase [Lactobacillus delbrueckii]|uniref:GNAT family N-acetyltransferase n=1 Tax=Lactobacillus delbrueckii TaxID=1584 RepID=UPI001E628E54|nr:GNAT family N-acetyltransferase [Lactobacillus delbrueckii]MCD5452036.1 GNAT family N-acetyltransferase [Lactobacillus delbrueckii subsp. lactis]